MTSRMPNKVAVVTGSNKGIGYAIVKGLCERFEGDVYLTARNEQRGLAAIAKLNKLGFKPKFHLLDVTIPESIQKLRDHIVQLYGGLDILINNAAIEFKPNAVEPFAFQAREVIRVNYIGLRELCDCIFPILKPHARVVNVSSSVGHLSFIPGKHLREILASVHLTKEKLNTLVDSFVKAAENGTHVQDGWPDCSWPSSSYIVSKVAVSALSRIQHKELLADESRPDIVLNHVHPGFVDTDMTNYEGSYTLKEGQKIREKRLTIEEGAEAPIFLALLPQNCTKPKGDYVWCTKQIVDWVNGPLPGKRD